MALQDIINNAVSIEVNRSKLVAQTISRSGRISTVSRNWSNPFRFTVTPKPVWTNAEYRAIFEPIMNNDRYQSDNIRLSEYSTSTGLAVNGQSWLTAYQGECDTSTQNNILDFYVSSSSSTGSKLLLNYSTGSPTSGKYLFKAGDYIRVGGSVYPYIVTSDVKVPTAVSSMTGTIVTNGQTVTGSYNQQWTTTFLRTIITGLSSTSGFTVGQVLTKISGTASFGGTTYVASIDSSTQISIVGTTSYASGSITFSGSGPTTSTNAVAVPIHRAVLDTVSSGLTILVGARAAQFNVIVTKLPQMRYLPGQMVEFTGDFELVEEIK